VTLFCLHCRTVLAGQKKEAENDAAKLQDEYTLLMAAARDEGPAGHLLDLRSKLAAHQTQCIAVRLIAACLIITIIVNGNREPAVNSTCCCSGGPVAGLLLALNRCCRQQRVSYQLVQPQTAWLAVAIARCLLPTSAPVFWLPLKACRVCGH